MKQCPQCLTTYTDNELKFCLQDGSRLSNVENYQMPTAQWNETEAETVIKPPRQTSNPQYGQSLQYEAAPEKKSVLPIILLSILGTLLLVGGGFAAWYFLNKSGNDVAVNVDVNKSANAANQSTPTPSPTVKTTPSATKTPTATPTAKPTVDPNLDTEAVKKDVGYFLDSWRTSSESGDLDATMENYADRVDYYRKSGATKDFIRNDKERAVGNYDTIELNISNVRVTPEGDGNSATAVFDKEWFMENSEKSNSGKVQQQLRLIKTNGKWRITSEKELKIYYVNK